MKKVMCFLLFQMFLINTLLGQDEDNIVENAFQGTRVVNGQSANLADDGDLLLLIQHRFGDISGGLYELFGLDVASMRLGFEYGLGNNLNLGVGRSTWLKTYDAFAKYRLVQQKSDFPLSAVLSVGGSVPTIRDYFPEASDNFSDKLSWNAQLHLSKTMGNFALHLSPGFLETGYIYGLGENLSVFTLGTAAAVRISKKVSANLEYLVPFSSEISGDNALSLGVDIDTGGHLFQLVLSNNNRMYHQAVYTNSTGSWADGNLYFGFNLIREFNLKYDPLWTE
ncbi:DUF5777 family beta-barrel protein [Draconibacterium halophilum]|uniref:DUF5777 domain-containing protein n=1 Tax=Draconibacterium halophilum TaxID=2706887 RepID=A0A6C0R8I4_9BACT|nr:DUF5777 family beta-barrel protein [Draconibacterium halophilum]QIA06489.1 hypothetical protein G0Q07_01535 [Draconibacterium halophilum]